MSFNNDALVLRMKRISMSPGRVVALCTVLTAIAAPSAMVAQGASLPAPLEIRVPKPPTVGTGETGSFLTYEVHVTSFTAQPLALTKLEVLSAQDQRVLSTLSDSSLVNAVARPGVVNLAGPERLKLAGGTRAVVFMWVPLEAGSAPTSIQHRLTVTQGTGDSASTRQLDGPVVPV